ncbi:odorant receptor 22c-like [Fopius arisanus]|uniref:Odorant receptor 22c-like n=1 Tax=Fopius arisanus TaxID=64838 RepID=A0A9R1TVP0_9HYME|nr:PREDICTED: odorant receptor 22c-like [Fopius arisanus]
MPRKTALAKGAFGKSKELLKKFSVFSDNDYLSKIGFNEMFRVPDTLLRTLGLSGIHSVFDKTPDGARHRIHNFATGDKGTDFDSEVVLLPVRYPFKIDTDLKYVLCAIFEVSCTIFLAMTYLGVDSLFHQSTTIVCLLLQTVGKKFGEVAVYAKGNMVDRRVWRQLHHIGEQHCELLLYCRRIEEIFNPLIFLMTLFTSANLCVSVISLQLELSSLQLGNIVILLTQVAAIVLQPFIYCNSAENISHRTKNIATSIYMCQWPEQTEKFKKIVLLIMLRSQHNYKFGQYGLFKVNHHLLTQLIHTAWNFLMILKKWEMPL